jgi:hypothetical protein
VSNRRRGPNIPRGRNRDFSELDSVETAPTENFTQERPSSRNSSGTVNDVGPAVVDAGQNTPITREQLDTFLKIVGYVLGCVGAIAGMIWWAATLQGNVDSLVEDVDSIEKSTRSLEKSSAVHEERLQRLQNDVSLIQSSTPMKIISSRTKKRR